MDTMELLVDLHKDGRRQGPGSDAHTRRAILLADLPRHSPLAIADIGCGSGASTLVLAEELEGTITAIDFLPQFLEKLEQQAVAKGLSHKISMLAQPMEELSFPAASLDVIWSEGAIYSMGFENGVKAWRSFIKPGGILAVSEITWLTDARPAELTTHWEREYPEIATASDKMAVLERNGYTPVGYFILPESAWMEEYYLPLQQRFAAFLQRNAAHKEALEIIAGEREEIALYERNKKFVSYGFYIARKTG